MFISAIVLLTIVFTIFIGRYMRENILRSKEEQLVTVADTLDSRLKSLEEPVCNAVGIHAGGQAAADIMLYTPRVDAGGAQC